VEIGESLATAVVREVLEETGLTVVPRRLVGVYSDPALQVVRYPNGNVWHYVNVCFECAVRAGVLTTCDETLALDWYAPRRLPSTLLPNHRIRIRDARTRRVAAFVR
jgi:ADP-ribose pyrophosphatase YjhB (NUDIX family)